MIRVSFNLVSARGPGRDRLLGTVMLRNDGTGSPGKGNYTVRVDRGGGGRTRIGRVLDFPRRSRSVFELLRRALNDINDRRDLP